MFDRDKWQEILSTMVKHPLRTLLTSVSVSVGIFILVVLLGLGQGLQNGVNETLSDDAVNSLWVRSGRTSIPYQGFQSNRQVQYRNGDRDHIVQNVEGVGTSSSRLGFWGVQIKWGKEMSNFSIRSVHPGHQEVERTKLTEGRFINNRDIKEHRKIAVIGKTIVEDLFGKVDPIGEFIEVKGVKFKVVGHFDDPASRWENRQVYIPISTGQRLFGNGSDAINMFIVSSGESNYEESIVMENEIDGYLRGKHKVHPEDQRGVSVRNLNEEFKTMQNIFLGINIFVFALGIMTMLAGIIGVSNIMSIVVKERTKEIGVRKAMGATPRSIISLILQEALFMTTIAGFVGLILGFGLLQAISTFIDHEFFKDPRVDFMSCIIALVLIVVAGALSGLLPAIRAVMIKPVEALRDE